MTTLTLSDIEAAAKRIAPYIIKTPIISSALLNEELGHEIYFKAENLQQTGAFKARGAINTLLWLKEKGQLPKKVVAYSSGNHAQAVAWASKLLNIHAAIFMPQQVTAFKLEATKKHGAQITLCQTRQKAEEGAAQAATFGAYLIPPYDHDQVICGQGTACLEALEQTQYPFDAIFAPCGGGGLLAGTLTAAKQKNAATLVFGAEPLAANDAAISLRENKIFRWEKMPKTVADGAKTLSISERTFRYIKKLDGIYEIPEEEIIYWTRKISDTLQTACEPTSALGLAAASEWLMTAKVQKRILVILSGGNVCNMANA